MMKRFRKTGLFWSVLIVAAISARGVRAASTDSPDAPAAQKLTQEFDLIPKLLAPAKSNSDGDPLKTISQRMTVVHGDLSKYATDEPVQNRERQIIRSLDEMIAALQRQRSGMSRGSRPGTGRKDSVIAKGDPSVGDLHGVDPNARQWAQLPPKLRSEILQSKTEGFPPGYESLLQSYYQQLAEEKSLDDRPAGAKPADTVKPGSP
jgi:hypothetical protein